jgi:hypothetical protein
MRVCLLILLFSFSLTIFSQSAFEVSDTNGNIITNAVLNVPVDYFEQISYTMDVKNISSSTKNVKMRKNIIANLANTNITMCTGSLCLAPNQNITPSAVALLPNTSLITLNQEYKAVFQPFGMLGNAIVKYTIFEDGGNDSVSVTFNFSSVVLSLNKVDVSEKINLKYQEDKLLIENKSSRLYTLAVYDLTGKNLVSLKTSEKNFSIDLPKSKIYFIRYEIDKHILTKKIISN